LLRNLQIETARDLLFHIPTDIHDFSNLKPVPQLLPDTLQAVQGIVVERDSRSTQRGGCLVVSCSTATADFRPRPLVQPAVDGPPLSAR
jgi:RecG-like helicase